MNSPMILVLASVLVSTMRSGCGSPGPPMSYHMLTDPVDLGKQFTAVCRVGELGGDGTLIAPEWVVTAAHVAEGMYRRNEGKLSVVFDSGTAVAVRQVFLHPKYEPMGRYDLALLQLDAPVADIVPVACYTGNDERGRLIIIAGHGDHRNADGTWVRDGRLRAYTNVIDAVDDTHIRFDYDAPGASATDMEGTSGPGDSGGPALLVSPQGQTLVGVSSMGEPGTDGPCSFGAVEHFVRVSRFMEWMEEVMREPNAHKVLGPSTLPGIEDTRSDTSKRTLGTSPREAAAQRITDALTSNDIGQMEQAIADTYDPTILARRDPSAILRNMPALVEQLSGARLLEVVARTDDRISLKLERRDVIYGLDIFFLPSDKIEQMAFGKIDQVRDEVGLGVDRSPLGQNDTLYGSVRVPYMHQEHTGR